MVMMEGEMSDREFAAAIDLGLRTTECQVCGRKTLYGLSKTGQTVKPRTCGRLVCMIATGEQKEHGWHDP